MESKDKYYYSNCAF